jgi:hypothetical protein
MVKNIPNHHKIYQYCCKLDQISIKYTNIGHCKALKNLPKLGFLLENLPSGNPGNKTIYLFVRMRYRGRSKKARIFRCWVQIRNKFVLFKTFKRRRQSRLGAQDLKLKRERGNKKFGNVLLKTGDGRIQNRGSRRKKKKSLLLRSCQILFWCNIPKRGENTWSQSYDFEFTATTPAL